ncbi:hypothetical protein DFH06DRAFT_1160653 [Mycena polygramma]|nr:hypothetical protein DFH06DRAFT_1160653 [Mycena polygramma]
MSTALLRQRLADIDKEIVEEKLARARNLAALERNRAEVQRQLDTASFFPVLTLPVEITAEIFSQCLATMDELRVQDYRGISMLPKHPLLPTLFMRVCQTWKNIALSTPVLWARLYICFDSIDHRVLESPGEIEACIERWLGRAALRPLSIAFRNHRHRSEDGWAAGPFTPSRMRDIIHRYADRIEYLELDFSQHDMRQLGLDSAVFPLLRYATLGDQLGPDPEPDEDNPVEIFGNVPHLHDLSVIPEGVLSYYSPPWSQLTKFDGEITNLELFTLAPHLIEARCAMEYLSLSQTSVVSHACLQSLTLVKSYNGQPPADILEHLTLPGLQTLHITSTTDGEYTSLFPFLARSSPPLRSLSIRIHPEIFLDWADCLCAVGATLEHLEVEDPCGRVQSAVLTCHRNFAEISPPLPRLETLVLKNLFSINYEPLLYFLEARTRHPEFATIRSFRLECSEGAFLDDLVGGPSAIDGRYDYATVTGHLESLSKNRGIDIHIGAGRKTQLSLGSR